MKKILLLLVAAVAALTLSSACGSDGSVTLRTTPIGDILANPNRFAEGTVTVKGVVSNPKGLGSMSVFTLSDHSGEIFVYCKHTLAPSSGETVKIQGTVCMPLRYNDYKIVYLKQTQKQH